MKTLTLIRHAKSSWSNSTLDDHDRPLNSRGQSAAPKIGAWLARQIKSLEVPEPDHLLSSTALRARTTAELIAPFLHFNPAHITLDENLYHASKNEILATIKSQIPESAQHAILFGHNPGFEYLATSLSRSQSDRTRITHFPTAAIAIFQFSIEFWALADTASATLLEFTVPRAL